MYAVNSARLGPGVVRALVEVNSVMTSAERALAYTEIKPEKEREIPKKQPKDWPPRGRITYNNVSIRHYQDGPNVLQNITFEIKASQKIGIVGRTGAGKSSLIASLLRMADTEGDIFIDDLNIKDVDLETLRSSISVISQTPVLFYGSLRENLDPRGEFEDSQIWQALAKISIANLVSNLPGKLENTVTDLGSNFSVGQRQMLHLARVLLKKNKIIILDEATGKIDQKTDEQIQEIIHDVFHDFTVLTVSHRLRSIQNCDRVIVLEQGTIAEFGKPSIVLNRGGKFM